MAACAAVLLLAGCETAAPVAPAVSSAPLPDDINKPAWAEQAPTPQDIFFAYPERARRLGVEAHVRLACTVLETYRLDCTVASEEVPDLGFGAAALRIAKFFVAKADHDPRIAPGLKVIVPIAFRLEE